MLPSHDAALRARAQGRTAALGGHSYTCAACGAKRSSSHSCRNRHGPTCQHDATQTWLERQQDLRLPVPSFLVTFTLPSELRAVADRHQRRMDNRLFRAAAAALMELARDPGFLGAQIGRLGVLQTGTRAVRDHPHVHDLVPGGGLADAARTWVTAKADVLVHGKPRAALVRAKLRAALRQTAFWSAIPATVWQHAWVVDCRPVGTARAALRSLAPDIFRVARSNNRIVRVADAPVTVRDTVSERGRTADGPLPAHAFLHRFLQHSVPKGCVKVRADGLFRVGMRRSLARLRTQLQLPQPIAASAPPAPEGGDGSRRAVVCPMCGAPMTLERVLRPHHRGPPRWVAPHEGRMVRRCGRWALWFALRQPASVCPSAVVTARRRCNAGRAARSCVLMGAIAYPSSTHELRACGEVRRQRSVP